MKKERNCKTCGVSIAHRDYRTKYCKSCADKREDEFNKKRVVRYLEKKKENKKQRFCETVDCNNDITHRRKNVKFCKDCSRIREIETRRKSAEKNKEINKEKNRKYMLEYTKKHSKLKTRIVNFFKEKYNCKTIMDLHNKIKEGECDDK
jgi:hypothetical protein